MSTPSEFFTISRVRDLTGLSMVTLTWIETELGDILQVRRTTGGNRLFTPTDVEHLKNVKRLMDEEGRSMAEAKALLFPDRFSPPAPATTPDDTMAAPRRSPADTLPPKGEETASPRPGDTVPGVPLAQILAADPHQYESAEAESGFAPTPVDAAGTAAIDVLLEATEGLVRENRKLRQSIDHLGARCMRLEDALEQMTLRGGSRFWNPFRRN